MKDAMILFALLRSAVCAEDIKKQITETCTKENLEAVYQLAARHDLAHLVAHALGDTALPDCEALSKLRNAKMRAIYRYAQLDYEYERICAALEAARDLDRNTPDGKQAFAERERLRTARRQARTLE